MFVKHAETLPQQALSKCSLMPIAVSVKFSPISNNGTAVPGQIPGLPPPPPPPQTKSDLERLKLGKFAIITRPSG